MSFRALCPEPTRTSFCRSVDWAPATSAGVTLSFWLMHGQESEGTSALRRRLERGDAFRRDGRGERTMNGIEQTFDEEAPRGLVHHRVGTARPERERGQHHLDHEALALDRDFGRQVGQRSDDQRIGAGDAFEAAFQCDGRQVEIGIVQHLRREADEADALLRVEKFGQGLEGRADDGPEVVRRALGSERVDTGGAHAINGGDAHVQDRIDQALLGAKMIMERGLVALAGGGVDLFQGHGMKAALAEKTLGRLHQAEARVATLAGRDRFFNFSHTASVMKRIREVNWAQVDWGAFGRRRSSLPQVQEAHFLESRLSRRPLCR